MYSYGRHMHVSLKECSVKCTVNSFNIHFYYSWIKILITVTSHWVCPFVFFYLLKIFEQRYSFWAQYFCTRLRGLVCIWCFAFKQYWSLLNVTCSPLLPSYDYLVKLVTLLKRIISPAYCTADRQYRVRLFSMVKLLLIISSFLSLYCFHAFYNKKDDVKFYCLLINIIKVEFSTPHCPLIQIIASVNLYSMITSLNPRNPEEKNFTISIKILTT